VEIPCDIFGKLQERKRANKIYIFIDRIDWGNKIIFVEKVEEEVRFRDLPAGAKFDYREDVNKVRAEIGEKIRKSEEGIMQALAKNKALKDEMGQILREQDKVFKELGITIGEANPVVKLLGKKPGLEMLGKFAEMAREQQKHRFEELGLELNGAWDEAIALAENAAKKKGGTLGELSGILLAEAKEGKSEGGRDEERVGEKAEKSEAKENKEAASGENSKAGRANEDGKAKKANKLVVPVGDGEMGLKKSSIVGPRIGMIRKKMRI
jgi:hypothetical protein